MTPLPIANPPFAIVQRIYRDARKSVPYPGGSTGDRTIAMQNWLRKIHAVFHRELKAAGIYVEGAE